MDFKNAIDVENISFRYATKNKKNRNDDFSLQGVSFSVPKGSIVGLIGENGAGKTTLLRLILSMYFQNSGSIKLFGEEASRSNFQARDRIGFVMGNTVVPFYNNAKKMGELLSGVYSNWDMDYYKKLLDEFEVPMKKRISNLSSGTIVKLNIASALAHHPDLLLLDEPMNNLDPIFRRKLVNLFRQFVKDENKTIFISSHLTEDLEKICDSVVYLHKGKVILSQSMDVIEENWGVLKIDEKSFLSLNSNDYIGYEKNNYSYEVLVNQKQSDKFKGFVCDKAKLQDIMYFYFNNSNFNNDNMEEK